MRAASARIRALRPAALLVAAAAMGAAALAMAPTPAATQVTMVPGASTEIDSDIQRFCTNIADAARDRRYSLQRAELETLKTEIDVRIAALEEKRAEYEEWLTRRNDFLSRAEDNLVDIYARMRPDAAAERLAQVNPELAAGILMKINARQAGVILNEMDTKSAATLTGIMASAARKQDPS